MKFEEWEPHYQEILDYFGFDRSGDENAAEIAQGLMKKDAYNELAAAFSGKSVTVCGNAPCLADDLKNGRITGIVCAADAAGDFLYRHGVRPEIIFTDLDGCEENFIEMNRKGTILAVHAHGDNIPLVKKWLPLFEGPVVLTTQSRPIEHVYNFGGFTDGDRCVFAAEELGAKEVRLVGFDIDSKEVPPMKHGKLLIARRLLSLLGYEV